MTVPCLAAALTALFLTHPFPFILSQRDREDVHLKARSTSDPIAPDTRSGQSTWPAQGSRGQAKLAGFRA